MRILEFDRGFATGNRRHGTMNIRSSAMRAMVRRVFGSKDLEGQGLVEYTMIILLVVIAVIGSFTTMADTIDQKFWQVISAMP